MCVKAPMAYSTSLRIRATESFGALRHRNNSRCARLESSIAALASTTGTRSHLQIHSGAAQAFDRAYSRVICKEDYGRQSRTERFSCIRERLANGWQWIATD